MTERPANNDLPQLPDRRLQVVFFPMTKGNPYQPSLARELGAEGIDVQDGPNGPRMQTHKDVIHSADVWHFHWLDQYLLGGSIIKTLAKSLVFFRNLRRYRLRQQPIVWTVHNLLSHDASHPRLQTWLLRRFARHVSFAIVHSQSAAAIATKFYQFPAEKVRVLPHPHYINDYQPPPPRQVARDELGIDAEAIVILFLGRVRPYKGLEALAAAMEQVKAPQLRVVIAGRPAGDRIDSFLRGVAAADPRIDYRPGFVADDAIPNYLGASDAVVLPYHQTFTSGAILLAASYRKAVIIPAIDTLMEAIAPNGAITYNPDEALTGGLASALREAIERYAELSAMGEYNYKHVAGWGFPQMASATASLYREALGSVRS